MDVFVFTGDKNSHGGGESRLLLSGITVVGILNQSGQVLAGKDSKALGSAAVPAVAEVLVTTTQANLLNAAANTGILSLARYLPKSRPVKDVPPVSMLGGSLQWLISIYRGQVLVGSNRKFCIQKGSTSRMYC